MRWTLQCTVAMHLTQDLSHLKVPAGRWPLAAGLGTGSTMPAGTLVFCALRGAAWRAATGRLAALFGMFGPRASEGRGRSTCIQSSACLSFVLACPWLGGRRATWVSGAPLLCGLCGLCAATDRVPRCEPRGAAPDNKAFTVAFRRRCGSNRPATRSPVPGPPTPPTPPTPMGWGPWAGRLCALCGRALARIVATSTHAWRRACARARVRECQCAQSDCPLSRSAPGADPPRPAPPLLASRARAAFGAWCIPSNAIRTLHGAFATSVTEH